MRQLKIFGNVLDILEGRVTPSLLRKTDQAKFRFALGGSTFTDEHCIGETLIIEGTPHISWVENGKLHTDQIALAKTPFLMGVDKNQTLGPLFHCNSPISLEALYGEFTKKYPLGVAVIGSLLMSMFSAIYVKRPPIYHENINQHHDLYWSDADHIAQAKICLFGVIIPAKAKQVFPLEKIKRAFYQNPLDKSELPFDSHTHSALVDELIVAKDSESLLQGMGHLKVKTVYHTLTESVIEKGLFSLFPLDEIVTE